MRRPGLAIAGAVLAAALVVGVWLAGPLTREAPRLLASNQVNNTGGILELKPGERFCQDQEQIPGEAQRMTVFAGVPQGTAGPLEITAARSGVTEILRARTPEFSATGPVSATLPAHPDGVDATICVRNAGDQAISIGGEPAGAFADLSGGSVPTVAKAGRLTDTTGATNDHQGRIRIEYPLEGGPQSPLEMAGTVARRSGLWHGAIGGPAWMWIALGLTLAAGALAVFTVVRVPRRALVLVAAVGLFNAVAWSLVTPLFQVPDEGPHFGYVQYFAETGKLPDLLVSPVPPEDLSLGSGNLPFSTQQKPDWVAAHERAVERYLEGPRRRVDVRGAGYVGLYPPLYYAAQALPYRASGWGTVYDRITVLRLVNALLAALLAALVFAFLRELAPTASPRLAVAGAVAVALHPMVGFLGGGVNPDTFLACEIAGMFWLFARMVRRGPDLRSGVGAGALMGAALLTKPAAIAIVPGGLLLLAALWLSTPRDLRRRALVAAGAAAAAATALFVFWSWSETALFGRNLSATGGFTNPETRGGVLNLQEGLSYLWQFYLPGLPFMNDQWPNELPLWRTWFQGFVGRFGWHQYGFPASVSWAGLVVAAGLGVLAARSLWTGRAVVRARWALSLALVGTLAVMALFVHAAGYRYRLDTGFEFEQVRYLFPLLLPLYAAFVALAVRGAGRFAVPAAAFLLTLLAGHALAAQLLTLQRYYL